VSATRVLEELARMALADSAQVFNEDGTLKPLKDIPEELRRSLSVVETTQVGKDGDVRLTKVRFWDKPKGLELLMKHL
jgi:hypothetical protein